jgi:hypothetical protein
MLSGSIEPLDQSFDLLIAEALTPAARSATIAEFARGELAEAEAANRDALGIVPPHTTTVDGLVGGREDNVRPDGVIVYQFALLHDVFGWIAEQLRTFAPVRTGHFRDSFEFWADGALTDPAGQVPPATEYVFQSSLVYAHQIEGDATHRPESRQAPAGVFEAVAALAVQHYGDTAQIRFSFRPALDGRLGGDNAPSITITTKA